MHPNQGHEVFEVSNVPDKNTQLTGLASERLTHFLSNFVHERFGQRASQSEIEVSNDTVISPALNKADLVPNLPFSSVTRIFAILFGVSAAVLGAWYFY